MKKLVPILLVLTACAGNPIETDDPSMALYDAVRAELQARLHFPGTVCEDAYLGVWLYTVDQQAIDAEPQCEGSPGCTISNSAGSTILLSDALGPEYRCTVLAHELTHAQTRCVEREWPGFSAPDCQGELFSEVVSSVCAP